MQQNNRIITTLSSDIYLNLHVCNFNCLTYVTLYFSTCGHLENFHDTKQLIISLKELCACYFFSVVMDHDFENWPLNRRLLPNTGPPYTGSTLYV